MWEKEFMPTWLDLTHSTNQKWKFEIDNDKKTDFLDSILIFFLSRSSQKTFFRTNSWLHFWSFWTLCVYFLFILFLRLPSIMMIMLTIIRNAQANTHEYILHLNVNYHCIVIGNLAYTQNKTWTFSYHPLINIPLLSCVCLYELLFWI